MVFPGVLRGRPGPRLATTPTNRPRRSLSSPGCCCSTSLAARRARRRRAGSRDKTTRSPSRSRNQCGPARRPFPRRVARPHTSWPRSLRLGSASGGNLDPARGDARAEQPSTPHPAEKFRPDPAGHARAAPKAPSGASAMRTCVRYGLSALPQLSLRCDRPRRVDAAGSAPAQGHASGARRPRAAEPVRASPTRTQRAAGAPAQAHQRARSPRSWRSLAKFFAAIKGVLLLLPKLKLLTTAGTALVSVAAYCAVLGLDVRDRLRAAAVRARDGTRDRSCAARGSRRARRCSYRSWARSSPPSSLGENALAEARVGLAGPILGHARRRRVPADRRAPPTATAARARLRRLLPEPLQPAPGRAARRRARDGRDGAVDVVPRLRRAGCAACCSSHNPILLIIVVFGGLETWRRWQLRKTRSIEQAAYYRVAPRHRLIVGRRLHRPDRRARSAWTRPHARTAPQSSS